jgi:hypothetical protein
MKEYDDGQKVLQAYRKLGISSQIVMTDLMTNILDRFPKEMLGMSSQTVDLMTNMLNSFPKEMQGSCLSEMCKATGAAMTSSAGMMEQACGQWVSMESEALRRTSDALKTVLSNMDQADMPPEPSGIAPS